MSNDNQKNIVKSLLTFGNIIQINNKNLQQESLDAILYKVNGLSSDKNKEIEKLLKKINKQKLNIKVQKKIDKAINELRYDDARYLLDDFLRKTHVTVEDSYKAHYQKALMFMEELKYNEAKDEFEKYIPIGILNIDILYDYGAMYAICGIYNQSLYIYNKILKLINQNSISNEVNFAKCYSDIARIYSLMGKYKNSKKYYQKSLNIRKEILGDEHPDTIMNYSNLAELLTKTKNLKKAAPLHKKAMNIWQEMYGEKYPEVIKYDNILIDNDLKNNYFLNHYDSSMNNIKNNDLFVAASLREHIANLYKLMGNYSQAQTCAVNALKIREEIFIENHPIIALSHTQLAELYLGTNEVNQAIKSLFTARAMKILILGLYHPETAVILYMLADCYLLKKEYKKAKKFYLKSLKIRQITLGETHPDTAKCYDGLSKYYNEIGLFDKANEYKKKFMDINKLALEDEHLYSYLTRAKLEYSNIKLLPLKSKD